jgi:hypothetical protein
MCPRFIIPYFIARIIFCEEYKLSKTMNLDDMYIRNGCTFPLLFNSSIADNVSREKIKLIKGLDYIYAKEELFHGLQMHGCKWCGLDSSGTE